MDNMRCNDLTYMYLHLIKQLHRCLQMFYILYQLCFSILVSTIFTTNKLTIFTQTNSELYLLLKCNVTNYLNVSEND